MQFNLALHAIKRLASMTVLALLMRRNQARGFHHSWTSRATASSSCEILPRFPYACHAKDSFGQDQRSFSSHATADTASAVARLASVVVGPLPYLFPLSSLLPLLFSIIIISISHQQ